MTSLCLWFALHSDLQTAFCMMTVKFRCVLCSHWWRHSFRRQQNVSGKWRHSDQWNGSHVYLQEKHNRLIKWRNIMLHSSPFHPSQVSLLLVTALLQPQTPVVGDIEYFLRVTPAFVSCEEANQMCWNVGASLADQSDLELLNLPSNQPYVTLRPIKTNSYSRVVL